jgi:hypothetical protein
MDGKSYDQRLEIAERMASKFAQSYDPRTAQGEKKTDTYETPKNKADAFRNL